MRHLAEILSGSVHKIAFREFTILDFDGINQSEIREVGGGPTRARSSRQRTLATRNPRGGLRSIAKLVHCLSSAPQRLVQQPRVATVCVFPLVVRTYDVAAGGRPSRVTTSPSVWGLTSGGLHPPLPFQ